MSNFALIIYSIQVVAAPWKEELVLRVMREIEDNAGFMRK